MTLTVASLYLVDTLTIRTGLISNTGKNFNPRWIVGGEGDGYLDVRDSAKKVEGVGEPGHYFTSRC